MELIRVNKKVLMSTIGIVILIGLFFILLTSAILSKEIIYSRIFIEEIEVSGLSYSEALEIITNHYNNKLSNLQITLKYNDRLWVLKSESIDFEYNYEKAVSEAYSIGRNNNWIDNLKEINSIRKNPKIIILTQSYNEAMLDEYIDSIALQINKEPINAKIIGKDGRFEIIDESPGVITNAILTKEKVLASLHSLNNDYIHVEVNNVFPIITREQLSTIKHLVGEFKTSFNTEAEGRSKNIEVAANKINGTLLMPNDIFSFNETTGPRSKEMGYYEAPIIVNNRFVPGVGGGVCQVSTTLYNAVLRSDLKILERRNHSLPVSYVPLGHDATVADTFIDFKFMNDKAFPIYIESFVRNGELIIRVYGWKLDDIKIELQSQVTEVIPPKVEVKKDPNMDIGSRITVREAKKGYRVDTYKIYYKSGMQVRREHISRDYYSPVNGEIIEGTRVVNTNINERVILEDEETVD